MKDFLKENKLGMFMVLATFVLGGVAIGTALRLYQLRTTPITPIAPERPAANETQDVINSCQVLVINFGGASPTASSTASASSSPSASASASSSASPSTSASASSSASASPTSYASSSPSASASALSSASPSTSASPTASSAASTSSSSPMANNSSAPISSSIAKATPSGSPAILPDAGVSLPTVLGIGAAGILILAAILLAL